MTWTLYTPFKEKLFTLANTIDFDGTDTIKCAWLTSAYTASASHAFFGSISANEVSGTNYSAGGNEVASTTVTTSAGTVTVDGQDPATWSQHSSGFSNGRTIVVYKDTSSAATSPLIAYNTFSTNQGNVSGDLTVQLSTSGIFTAS
jgi:hypothetical protein